MQTKADRPRVLGTLGEYEVQEVIGQGGIGVVLRANDPALHRLDAVPGADTEPMK